MGSISLGAEREKRCLIFWKGNTDQRSGEQKQREKERETNEVKGKTNKNFFLLVKSRYVWIKMKMKLKIHFKNPKNFPQKNLIWIKSSFESYIIS